MAYSRNTRNTRNVFNAAGAAPRSGLMRFASELALTGGFVALVFLVMALASYSPQDAAWSTSGLATGSLHNLAGQPGAWVADVAYVLLGYSAWWCVAAAAFAWGAGVLAWLRGNARQRIGAAAPREEANQRRFGGRLAFWLGLALLLPASSGLEWLRLHRLDSGLPGNAGGVLGHLGGQVAVQWLGAPGATLAGLALLACALALVFHFSWGRLAERIGALVYGVLGAPRQQLAGAQDAWHGARAARERGQALRQERAALQEGLEEGMAEGLSPAYADSQFDAGHISQFSPEPVASGMADGVPTFLQSGAAAATGGNGRVEPAFAVPGAAAGGAASRGSAIPALSRLFGRERAAAPVPGAPVQMAGPIGTGGRIEPSFEFGAMPQPSVPAFMQGGAQPGAAQRVEPGWGAAAAVHSHLPRAEDAPEFVQKFVPSTTSDFAVSIQAQPQTGRLVGQLTHRGPWQLPVPESQSARRARPAWEDSTAGEEEAAAAVVPPPSFAAPQPPMRRARPAWEDSRAAAEAEDDAAAAPAFMQGVSVTEEAPVAAAAPAPQAAQPTPTFMQELRQRQMQGQHESGDAPAPLQPGEGFFTGVDVVQPARSDVADDDNAAAWSAWEASEASNAAQAAAHAAPQPGAGGVRTSGGWGSASDALSQALAGYAAKRPAAPQSAAAAAADGVAHSSWGDGDSNSNTSLPPLTFNIPSTWDGSDEAEGDEAAASAPPHLQQPGGSATAAAATAFPPIWGVEAAGQGGSQGSNSCAQSWQQQQTPSQQSPVPQFYDGPAPLPQLNLLDAASDQGEAVTFETLELTSRLIEKKLKDFGVHVKVVDAAPGPVITRYEIEPAPGVKGSRIVNLAKDLARSLSLVSIRVIETIPGKNCMALELPNTRRQSIRLIEVLDSEAYQDAKSLLTVGLGKDIIGRPVVADLAKMPHVLVAGTTGSGKSVGINAMILSLLYKADPSQVRLVLIDPKMLEMSVYEGIPHLLCPVVTDMKQAANALAWCVDEMERRYRLMSRMGVRNLAGYNAKIAEASARGQSIPNPFSLTPDAPEPLVDLPSIVVIVDELADLMMTAGKKIEELIARLAQKARAAGIYLVLATQRPSTDVLTGLIKANVPTRMSFKVASYTDSRIILDCAGAETLLGMGDMLYKPNGGIPERVHGAFVSDDEVHRVANFLRAHSAPNYVEGVLEGGVLDEGNGGGSASESEGAGGAEQDSRYDEAVDVVLKTRRASISWVQRQLRIGYGRAARLLDDMERAGLVSAMDERSQREILVPAGSEEE